MDLFSLQGWGHALDQGFSALVLLTSCARQLFGEGSSPVCLRMFNSILGLCLLDPRSIVPARTTNDVSRLCRVSPGVESSLAETHRCQFPGGQDCLTQPQGPCGPSLCCQQSFSGTRNLSTSPGSGYSVLSAHGFYILITQMGSPRSSLTLVHSGHQDGSWMEEEAASHSFPFSWTQTILAEGRPHQV